MRGPNLTPSKIVRPHRPEEVVTLAQLFTETVRAIDPHAYSPEQLAAWAPDPPDIDHWRARLTGLNVLVAEQDSAIAGFVTFDLNGHLDHLYVRKQFQRKGIALALCLRLEQEARSRGVRRMYTDASITARPFFERAGYDVIAPQTVKLGAISLTNYRMEKWL